MTFTAFLEACNIMPPEHGIEPGRWVRCGTAAHPRKRNAGVKLADDRSIGWVMNFEAGNDCQTWRMDGVHIAPAPLDVRLLADLKRDRDAEIADATARALTFYNACEPLLGKHPYLVEKELGMLGCHLLRVDKAGRLVAAMRRKAKLVGYQTIAPDGTKRFAGGVSAKAGYHGIVRPGATGTVFCEGLATGITIYQACPALNVAVCFSAGNLAHVIRALHVHGWLAVAADNDHVTAQRIGPNPGMDAARAAASEAGIGLCWPECQGTDFNDLYCERLTSLQKVNLFSRLRKRGEEEMRREALEAVAAIIAPALVWRAPILAMNPQP